MTKRVAWFTGEPSVKECFTPYKVYEVVREEATNFSVINDKGVQNFCLKNGCAHICHRDWAFADVVEEDMKVETVKVEEVKRKGVMALLPEDSKFEIGQRVRVDRSGYIGYTTIIGYNYDYDEYATECDKDNSCSHDCEGLAEKKGFGLWVVESDIIESVEAKQPKWSDWIENTTGEQPEGLDDDVKVKLHWNDGDVTKSTIGAANWFFSESVNITHYKVKQSKWTKNTGWMPVDCGVKIEVKLRGGIKEISQADDFYWSFENEDTDIIKWRLAE